MASLQELVAYLDAELRTAEIPDNAAALNGLQLENDGRVSRIAAAVDFSMRSVRAAVAEGADLLLVHHGMFWEGSGALTGHAFARLRAALDGNLAVFASHIPLDLHPVLGNNALLAAELGLQVSGSFGAYHGVDVGVMGECDLATSALFERVRAYSSRYGTIALLAGAGEGHRTSRWAMVTGAGASPDTLREARAREVDTLIVGEGPHHTAVDSFDRGPAVIYAGHYATETLGVRALAARAAERFHLPWSFLDLPTGL